MNTVRSIQLKVNDYKVLYQLLSVNQKYGSTLSCTSVQRPVSCHDCRKCRTGQRLTQCSRYWRTSGGPQCSRYWRTSGGPQCSRYWRTSGGPQCSRYWRTSGGPQCSGYWRTSGGPTSVSARWYCTKDGESDSGSCGQKGSCSNDLRETEVGDVDTNEAMVRCSTAVDIEDDADGDSDVRTELHTVDQGTGAKGSRAKSPDKTRQDAKQDAKYVYSSSSDMLYKSMDSTDFPVQDDITNFLNSKEIPFSEGFTGYHLVCPKFGKLAMKKKKKDDDKKLYVNSKSGYFVCNSCKVSGYWRYLRDNIVCQMSKKASRTRVCFKDVTGVHVESEECPTEVQKQLENSEHFSTLSLEQFDNILAIFDWHGIKRETFIKYGVRYRVEGDKYYVLFPIQSMRTDAISAVRVYAGSGNDDDDVKITVDTYPRNRELKDLFGWQHRPLSKTLVITASEANALAISQATSTTVLALKSITQMPLEILPPLEEFTKIILWIGTDINAWDSTNSFAKKLNDKRCCIFRLNTVMKMPLQMLQEDADLKLMLQEARPISHKDIVKFSHIRGEVYSELAHLSQVAGVQWQKHTPLNKTMKGHRRGELTVLTGPTGSGKTTFVSDYSLDLCMQGVNTLWGSFEINNVKLAKMMLKQFCGKDLTKHLEHFDQVADDFAALPMYFMTYFGQENVNKVLEVMTHAVYVHDISHVVIDNLQFMMGMDFTEGNRFIKQDHVVATFRQFATDKNCHVTLITHPRKVDTDDLLSTASVFGSAKLTQEADNVLLIQDIKIGNTTTRLKLLQLAKNRFDGELDLMGMTFDKESLSFTLKERKRKPFRKNGAKPSTDMTEEEEES